MSKVVVSGGTGLAGRYIVEGFLAAGAKVTVAGREPPQEGLFPGQVAFTPLALDPSSIDPALFDGADIFVHAAFKHQPGLYRGGEGDDPAGFIRANVDGSIALFNAARDAGVKRCIFLSSRAVFDGYPAGTELPETLEPKPQSLYGKVKLEAERALFALAAPGFVAASLRATGIYGDLHPNKWDGLFARYAAGEQMPARAGSEVHGRDVADALLVLAEAPVHKVSGKAFHASDIVTDNHTILAALKSEMASSHPLPPRGNLESVSVMSTGKLNALGWRSSGMPLFDATVKKLSKDFVAGMYNEI